MNMIREFWVWSEDWLQWMVASGTGWFLSTLMAALVAIGVGSDLPAWVRIAVFGVPGGVLLGLFQWIFLRPPVRSVGLWLAATALSWLLALVLWALLPLDAASMIGVAGSAAAAGLLVGVTQRAVLRTSVPERNRWLLMTVAGWAVAQIAGALLSTGGLHVAGANAILEAAASWGTGALAIAVGAALLLVTLYPRAEARDPRQRIRWSAR